MRPLKPRCTVKRPLRVADGRFAAHRSRYDIRTGSCQPMTWWQECILGPVELIEYRLVDKLSGRSAARVRMWEMETYVSKWNEHAIGITDLAVSEQMQRQGLAKYLMVQLLGSLEDQFFTLVEMQADDDNTPGINLLRGLDFDRGDVGHLYRKSS